MGNTSAIPCSVLGDPLDLGQDNQELLMSNPARKPDITPPPPSEGEKHEGAGAGVL